MFRTPSSRRPVSAVDAAWLRMDSPTNPMVITAILRFAAPIDEAPLRATLSRLLEHRKFKQRVVRELRTWTRSAWEDDPDFDLSHHVERVTLPPPGDERALDAFIGERMSEPLDRARPLWRATVIEGIPGGSALLVRVHHAVGDGVTLVRVLLGVSGAPADRAPVEVGLAPRARAKSVAAQVGRAQEDATTLLRLLSLPPDHPTRLRGTLSTRKLAAMSGPIALRPIKDLARTTGGSVNDFLVSAIAGALRAYLGDDAPPLRALVPVFLRGSGPEGGNQFGLVYLPLAPNQKERALRLEAVKAAMDTIKAAPDAKVAFVVLGAMGFVSPTVERVGIDLFTSKASMLITNVPGPAGTVQVCGQDVASMAVWAPTSGSIGVGFSLLTYAGELRLGVAADANLGVDPRELIACFVRELDAMRGAP